MNPIPADDRGACNITVAGWCKTHFSHCGKTGECDLTTAGWCSRHNRYCGPIHTPPKATYTPPATTYTPPATQYTPPKTYTASQSYTSSVPFFACTIHKLAFPVVTSSMVVTAGSLHTPQPLGSVIVSLIGRTKPASVRGLPGYKRRVVYIDWPDMGVPDLTHRDWTIVADGLKNLRKPIHIHCLMGHGRTGTALAILLCRWGIIPEGECPVEWVRAHYCKEAVETNSQLDYVEHMTDRLVTATVATASKWESYSVNPGYTVGYTKPEPAKPANVESVEKMLNEYDLEFIDDSDDDIYGGIDLSPTKERRKRRKRKGQKSYKQPTEKWGI